MLYSAVAAAFELVFRTERSAWSYTSISAISRVVQLTTLVALTFLELTVISNRGISLPRSTIPLSWIMSLFALIGVKVMAGISQPVRHAQDHRALIDASGSRHFSASGKWMS